MIKLAAVVWIFLSLSTGFESWSNTESNNCAFAIEPVSLMAGFESKGYVAHELEDGEINRTIQVTLRDDKLFLRYAIGLNDNTLRQLYETASGKSAPEDLPTLQSNFESIVDETVFSGIDLTLNNEPVKKIKSSATQSGKHHERFIVNIQWQMEPQSKTQQLAIADKNFSGHFGAIRMALRARGKAMLLSSNVEPVIARAKPIELKKLSDDQRKEKCVIESRIKVLPSK